jgi:hypothetical protein
MARPACWARRGWRPRASRSSSCRMRCRVKLAALFYGCPTLP